VLVWSEAASVDDDDHHFTIAQALVAIGHSRELQIGVDDVQSVTPTWSSFIDVELTLNHLAAIHPAAGNILGHFRISIATVAFDALPRRGSVGTHVPVSLRVIAVVVRSKSQVVVPLEIC